MAQQGLSEQAIELLQQITQPTTAVLQQLAQLQLRQQLWDDAITTFASLQQRKGKLTELQIDELYHSAADAGIAFKTELALELHCRLLASAPQHANGLRNLSILLRRIGAYDAAATFIQRYLAECPSCIHGWNTYGTILSDLGRHAEAVSAYHKVLTVDPSYPEANSNLACEYHFLAQIDLAFAYSSRAVALSPRHGGIWLDHLTYLRRVCAFDRLACVHWWVLFAELPPELISSSFLQALVMAEQPSEQHQLLGLINRWGDHQAAVASESPLPPPAQLPKDPSQPLGIGFVSADFRDHSIARFLWPLFEHLDRSRFSLFGYSTFQHQDRWRKRFDQSADAMRDVAHLSPLELCRAIRADEIHILFDLTGFTKGSRTSAFAWRAAHAQVSWLGFPGSTGLPQMDFLFLDRHLAPADPSLIREQPLLSPGTTVCFSQIDEVPITPTIPELVRGYLTFGTLNNSYKITPSTIRRWALVLNNLPTAQFLFVRREFQSFHLRANIRAEFGRHGISGDRIHFLNNRLACRHYLDCYNEIDITLDTYPVTGGTTTTDALWMGVPVVALEGPNVHQRVCSAILRHAGHPEWIATSDGEFLQIALDLASDQERRTALRQSLRSELKASPLCNTQQFAADFAHTMDLIAHRLSTPEPE